MPGRIVLFGATGYTGRLTAEALVARDERPVLAGRSADRLAELGSELGGLETAVADVGEPGTVRALVDRDDVLVATVGPFLRFGEPALEAAIEGGAHYLDSTGEPPFIRRVFDEHGPRAGRSGVALVTAFGYDFVPGNLAGALALRDAGERAERVEIGYFTVGQAPVGGGASGGTRASAAAAALRPAFSWREGIRDERTGTRRREFEVEGRRWAGLSIGSSEHLSLPRVHPGLREVDVYLGWFGKRTRRMQRASAALAAATRVPGVAAAMERIAARSAPGSSGGPSAEERARSGSHVVAIASGSDGEPLAEVHVTGLNAYDFTARVLAWGASRAAQGAIHGTGALGPVEAFGLDDLEAGCAEAGISRADP